METRLIETIVRRLFDDAEFRATAVADTDAALAEYRLSDQERVALVKLCSQLSDGPLAGGGNGGPVIQGVWF